MNPHITLTARFAVTPVGFSSSSTKARLGGIVFAHSRLLLRSRMRGAKRVKERRHVNVVTVPFAVKHARISLRIGPKLWTKGSSNPILTTHDYLDTR
jgi:hypothetical protein